MSSNPSSQQKAKSDRRVLAVGDIHGCALELEALIRKMAPGRDDLVVFLGDYIDRGTNSQRVIDIVLELGTQCEVVPLWGNHEHLFVEFLQRPGTHGAGMFILNGGSSTLASYGGPDGSFEIPEAHINFFNSLKYTYETDTHFFVHAGVPDIPLSQLDLKVHASQMLWIRQPFLKSNYRWEKVVVHGHTPSAMPEIKPNRINVDTGCVYDGCLTAIDLSRMKFIQVEKGIKGEPPLFPRQLGGQRVAMRFEGRIPVVAWRPGEKPADFETLNFNQFGLLIRDARPNGFATLEAGDPIEGIIGRDTSSQIHFTGRVARVVDQGMEALYGVHLDRVSDGAEGRYWIERPDEKDPVKK